MEGFFTENTHCAIVIQKERENGEKRNEIHDKDNAGTVSRWTGRRQRKRAGVLFFWRKTISGFF